MKKLASSVEFWDIVKWMDGLISANKQINLNYNPTNANLI